MSETDQNLKKMYMYYDKKIKETEEEMRKDIPAGSGITLKQYKELLIKNSSY